MAREWFLFIFFLEQISTIQYLNCLNEMWETGWTWFKRKDNVFAVAFKNYIFGMIMICMVCFKGDVRAELHLKSCLSFFENVHDFTSLIFGWIIENVSHEWKPNEFFVSVFSCLFSKKYRTYEEWNERTTSGFFCFYET